MQLGPDPLAPGFDPAAATERLLAYEPAVPVGEALLDQSLIAGIGNVIRIEACFLPRVSPWRRVADLTPEEARGDRRRDELGDGDGDRQGQPPEADLRPRPPPLPALRRPGHDPRPGRRQPRHLLVRGLSAIIAAMGEEQASAVDLLARVPLLSGLEPGELERIAQVAIPRSFPKGARVFHEGDTSDACYVIRSGEVRVTREHPDGRAIALATLGPGELVGELAMIDGGVRSASVEALTDVDLLAVSATDMRGLLERNAQITAKLVVALTKRLRETNERISRQSFQTVPSRVAGVLSQLVSEDNAEQGRDGVTIRMNQADLAQLAGTSRESVSRFLAVLERAGVVRVGRGRVTVLEPHRLRAYIF